MRPGSIEYDPVLAEEILERLADGDSSRASAAMKECRTSAACDGGRETTAIWLSARVARRLGYEKRADELLEIADTRPPTGSRLRTATGSSTTCMSTALG